MPLIKFPKIPDLPGVPSLPRLGIKLPGILKIGLGLLQNKLFGSLKKGGEWGIFDKNGKQLGVPDNGSIFKSIANFIGLGGLFTTGGVYSTGGVEYGKETKISDFPVEKGSFASYNKVEQPSAPTVTFFMSGSESERKKFLEAIDKACKSTDLYSLVTPEATYINHSIEHYNYSRTSAQGMTLLKVEVGLKEIRQVSAIYAKTEKPPITTPKLPSAKGLLNAGKIQAKLPDVSLLVKTATALPNFAQKASSFVTGLIR